MEKSAKIFPIIKYLKKAHNVFVHQQYWLIQFIEKIKTIILQRFQKNVLLKKKRTSKFIIEISSDDSNKEDSDDSDKEDSDEENSNEENSNEEN